MALAGNFDIVLAYDNLTRGFILNRDDDGNVAWRPGVAPLFSPQQPVNEFSTQHIPPEIEVPIGFQDWSGGAGFEEADSSDINTQRVYNYTRGVDLSWGTRGYLSPQLQTGGTVTTTFPKKFLWSETLGLFSINDRYVYEWTGSAWTQRFDAGASGLINDIVEYSNNDSTYLMLGLRSAPYAYSEDGSSWIQETVAATPAFRAEANATAAAANTVTINKPAGTVEDDVLLAFLSLDDNLFITPPAGWVLNRIAQNATSFMWIWWKRAGGSEPADYTFTTTAGGNTDLLGVIAAYSAAATSGSPIDVGIVESFDDTSETTHDVGPMTTTGDNRLIVAAYTGVHATSTWTAPGGYSERADVQGSGRTITVDDIDQASAGSTGTVTATSSAAITTCALLIALSPSESTGGENISRWAVRGSTAGIPLLWALSARGDMRNTTDPTTPAGWSASDVVHAGQVDFEIAGMPLMDNTFYIFRDTEITSYDGITVSTVYSSPTFKLATDAARPFLWVDGKIYFTYNFSLYSFSPINNAIVEVWPPRKGNAELNGTITAIAGDERDLYFAIKNIAGNTYIMKGDPRKSLVVGTTTVRPFHTWAYRSTGDVLAMLVVPADSDALSSTNLQLVIGDDASADYFLLPRAGFRPEDDANYRFDTGTDNPVYGTFIDWGANAFTKFLNRGVITADDIDTNDTITLQYQLPGDSAITVVTANGSATADRYEAALTAEVEFTKLRYVGLFNNGASTTTPILEGFAFHATLNPPRKRMWSFDIKLAASQGGLESDETGQDPRDMESYLFTALSKRVTMTDVDGTDRLVRVLDVQGASAQDNSEAPLTRVLTVIVVEV